MVLSNASDIGSVAALTATTTTLAAASGGITAMLTNMLMSQQNGDFAYDLPKTMNGALCGLVAVTASCGVIEPWAAIFIGCLAGLIYLSSSHLLRIWRIDDAVDGIPVHFFGGLWGVFAVGLFASPNRLNDAYGFEKHVGFFYSLGRAEPDASLLSTQIFEIFFILGWTSALMIPFFLILNRLGWLRPGEIEEIAGLDACYQHAVQEDQEQLKRSIKEELRRHGRERKHSDAASTTEPGSV